MCCPRCETPTPRGGLCVDCSREYRTAYYREHYHRVRKHRDLERGITGRKQGTSPTCRRCGDPRRPVQARGAAPELCRACLAAHYLASANPREANVQRLALAAALGDALEAGEVDEAIVPHVLGDDVTREELGAMLGVSRERVRQIEASGLAKLRDALARQARERGWAA